MAVPRTFASGGRPSQGSRDVKNEIDIVKGCSGTIAALPSGRLALLSGLNCKDAKEQSSPRLCRRVIEVIGCLAIWVSVPAFALRVEILSEVAVVSDPLQYNAFPGICRAPNGDILIIYRNAPTRPRTTHLDPASRCLLVRSTDGGQSFEIDHPVTVFSAGGMQDPSLTALKDGRLLASTFRWRIVPLAEGAGTSGEIPHLKDASNGWMGWVDGIYLAQSSDSGRFWSKPWKVEIPGFVFSATSEPVLQLRSGKLLLPFYGIRPGRKQSDAACAVSSGDGKSWEEVILIASDTEDKVSFEEPALLQVEGGRILCVMRTGGGGDGFLYSTWSDNFLKSWTPHRRTEMWGHPPNLILLRDGRILCTYGYRRAPYQVRASVSKDRGETWDVANEITLRLEGGPNADIGYPSSLQLQDGSILTAYYFQDALQTRFIGLTHFRLQ